MVKLKHKKNILTDTLEAFTDAGKQTAKDTAKQTVSVVDINAFLYGKSDETPTEKTHTKTERAVREFGVDEKTKKENEQMKANHTPLDVQAIRDKHQLEQIKKRLFDFQKSEGEKARKESDEKEEKRKQEETEEEEKKKKEKEEAARAQPAEDAHGKSKVKLGQARKKASTDPHQNFEQKANRGK